MKDQIGELILCVRIFSWKVTLLLKLEIRIFRIDLILALRQRIKLRL